MTRRIAPWGAAITAALSLVLVGVSHAGPLPAAVGDEPEVHFTAAGDYGAGADTRAVLTTIAGLDPDLNLALGDLSYGTTGAEQQWCDLVTQHVGAGFPFELIAGNHESNGQNGNINDFSACLPNQLPGAVGTDGRQWYVDVPAQDPLVRFVMISPALPFPDGTWDYSAGSARYAWTSDAIDGARTAGVPWVVVGMHKPCLSIGVYPCESGPDLLNLFLSKDVDLVLQGHEHAYLRTKQLGLNADCPAVVPNTFDADCIADDDATLDKGAGTVFATVGTGGVPQRALSPADPEASYFAAAWGLGSPTTWGVLDLRATATTLSAAFVRSSGGTATDGFTIGSPDPNANQAPTASFTASCTELECTVDGSASGDADGTVTGHAWGFGDGATASGPTATHTYAAGGTYTVTLTVTDDDGATGTTTRTVSPVSSTAPFAADTFTRTVTNGLGIADTGGAWRTSSTASSYAVSAGTARVTLPTPSTGRDMSLPVAAASTDLTFTVAIDKPATGSGVYVAAAGRRVAGAGDYRAKLALRAGGSVALSLVRTSSTGAETTIAPAVTVPGASVTPGTPLEVRVQVTGSGPTTIRARAWSSAATEPTGWQVSATDATTGLQGPGVIAFNHYLSSSATNAPLTVLIDDVTAAAP